MNAYGILGLITSINSFGMTIFLATRWRSNSLSRILSAVTLTSGIWGISSFIFSRITQNSYELALLWWQIGYTTPIFSVVFYTHFVLMYLKKKNRKIFLIPMYLVSVFLIYYVWYDNSKLFLCDLQFVFNQFYWHDWIKQKKPLFLLYYIGYYWILLGFPFILLVNAFIRASGIVRNQLKYLILGSMIGWLGVEGLYLVDFRIYVYPYCVILMGLYPAVWVYAIVRYHLMDIEILIKKTTFITTGVIIPVALLYVILSYIQPILSSVLGPAWLLVPVGLSIAIGLGLLRFVKFILQMNEADLSKRFAYRPMLEKEAERTARARDVREMATFIVRDVSSFTRLDHTAVFILNEQKNAYSLMSSVYRKKDRPKLETGLLLSIHSPLVAFLKEEKKPAVYGQIMHDLQNKDLTTHERKFLEAVESAMAILGAEISIPSFCEDEMVGILNLGNKLTGEIFTGQDLQAFQTLANQTGRAIAGLLLKNEKIRLIVSSQKSLLETLEARDHYTRGHTERVSTYSQLLGNRLERLIHSIPNSISALNWTAQLHDLGKVAISDNILLKPSALTDEEFAKIKEHPTRGIEILGPLKEWFGEDIIQGVVHHHENYDGTGYPDKQKGNDIHIFARIIRVADAFDAMTTDRPYRKGLSIEEAMAEVKKFRKIQFDPVIADGFIELFNDGTLKKVMDELKKKYG